MQAFVGAMTTFLFIGEMFNDLNLALKIFALLTIISFVSTHLGKSPLAYAVIAGISVFVLLDFWVFFGGLFILWTLLGLGITGMFIDFFFVSNMGGGGQQQEHEPSPVDHSGDLAERARQLEGAKMMHGHGGPVGPPGMAQQAGAPRPPGGGQMPQQGQRMMR